MDSGVRYMDCWGRSWRLVEDAADADERRVVARDSSTWIAFDAHLQYETLSFGFSWFGGQSILSMLPSIE